MKTILGLVAALLVLTFALPAAAQRRTVRYACAGGRAVTVIYGAGWADISAGGRSSRLNAVRGAGSRYSDGRWVWRLAGSTGTLTRDGRTIASSCRAR